MGRVLISLMLMVLPANADFEDVPSVNVFSALSAQLEDAAWQNGLSEQFAEAAKVTASTWVYLGPCKGVVAANLDPSAVATVANADPKTAYGAAILEMIGIMLRYDSLGRPIPQICAFAKAMAKTR